MKTLRNYLPFIFLISLAFKPVMSFSQSTQVVAGSEEMLAKLRLNDGIKGIQYVMYSEIKGNPYIFPDFMKATLTTVDDESISIPVRYDIYAGQMHLKNKDQIFAIARPEKIKLIQTDSLKFIYTAISNNKHAKKDFSYFIVNVDGKCQLLVRKSIRIQDSEPPKPYQDAKPPVFINLSDSYFIKVGDSDAIPAGDRKEILSAFSDHKESISTFMTKNSINLKKHEDLKKLVAYYNSL